MPSHSDYDFCGFRSQEIFPLLERHGIVLAAPGGKKLEPKLEQWKLQLRAMPKFAIWEAACIMADDDPHPPDYGGYDNQDPELTADVHRFKRLLIAAIDEGELPAGQWGTRREDQEIRHADLRDWCAKHDFVWPIPSLAPRPTTSAEALAEIEQLKSEVERLRGELAEAKEGLSMVDHEHWPEELDIALMAWRAALTGAEQVGKKPGAFIREWLEKTYGSKLNATQRDRIATVANWDKTPGPK